MHSNLRPTLLYTALALALSACGRGDAGTTSPSLAANADTPRPLAEQALVDELTSSLQACSYDGQPVTLSAQAMSSGSVDAGAAVVSEIMKYTGLPQNFDVIQSNEVPNAAAVILLGQDQLPRRVIAYNDRFMSEVRSATANNDWAPISIMAHEIGHHLSGHTIQPGGSQPPTELEADKFSGFVLYKMGAVLADATKAMNTLVPEADGPTHPGRGKRVQAIAEGWQQACAQQGRDCSDGAQSVDSSAQVTSVASAQADTPKPTPSAEASSELGFPSLNTGGGKPADATEPTAATIASVDVLPAPDSEATPSKFGKFVIDEMGLLDPAARAQFEQEMFKLAAAHQIEIVTVISKDLHGLSADDYAYAMMRQLRVGKLDVGNGAVLVMAPNEKQVGLAFGPGIMLEMRDYVDLERQRLNDFLDTAWPYCKGRCNADQTEMAFAAAEHIADDASQADFGIRYQSLGDLLAADAKANDSRAADGDQDLEQDLTWRKIARITGTVVSRSPAESGQTKWINDIHAELVGAPIHVRSDDGRDLLLYMNQHTEQLMVKKLVSGQKYVFVTREVFLSQNPEDTLSFDVLSFDQTP